MEALKEMIAWIRDDPYITIFLVTFTIGLLKACHDLMKAGFQKSAIEAMLVAALTTIFCRSTEIAGGQVKYEAMLLIAAGISYLGIKHTDIMVKAMLKILFIPIDKMLGTKLSDTFFIKEDKDDDKKE